MRKFLILIIFFSCVNNSDTNNVKPLNIIMLVGDGMGLPQITGGMYVNNNQTELENFQYIYPYGRQHPGLPGRHYLLYVRCYALAILFH